MSASGFLDLLDLVLKQSDLSDREGPVRLDEFASRCNSTKRMVKISSKLALEKVSPPEYVNVQW